MCISGYVSGQVAKIFLKRECYLLISHSFLDIIIVTPFAHATWFNVLFENKNEIIFAGMSTKAEAEDLDALKQAIADVRSDTAGVGRKSWVLVGHRDNNANLIGVVGQDVTDAANLEDFTSQLQEDQVMYGLIRLSTTFDMSATVKFVYVHWYFFMFIIS